MSAEIRITSDITALTPKSIDFNYDEVKQYLTNALEKYKGLVVTPESVREAKEAKAKINKASKHIDEYRLSVKKIYCAPLTDFEKKCKELTAMCGEVSEAIAVQTRQFDEDKRTAKIARLKAYFMDKANECGMTKNLDELFALVEKNAWGNVTYPEEAAMAEIDAFISGGTAKKSISDRKITFTVSVDEEQANALRAFLDKMGVGYTEE